jgi:hypothetical protein
MRGRQRSNRMETALPKRAGAAPHDADGATGTRDAVDGLCAY